VAFLDYQRRLRGLRDGHGGRSSESAAAQQVLRAKAQALRWLAQCGSNFTQLQKQQQARSTSVEPMALAGQEGQMQGATIAQPAIAHTTPKFPFEPLLDVDFILDADNYLEDYMNAPEIPQQLAEKYTLVSTMPSTSTTSTSTTTSTTSTSTTTTAATVPILTTLPPTTTTTTTTTITTTTTAATTILTTTPVPLRMFSGCVTKLDPRVERRFQFLLRAKPAPEGMPCAFGVTPGDEGEHCIHDGGRFGSFGWCYTDAERTQWGSCSEACPPGGSTELLAARIDALTEKVQAALAKVGASHCNFNATRV